MKKVAKKKKAVAKTKNQYVRTIDGQRLTLTARTLQDGYHMAKRAEVKRVLLNTDETNSLDAKYRLNKNGKFNQPATYAAYRSSSGEIGIGCKFFEGKDAAKLAKWAGIKS